MSTSGVDACSPDSDGSEERVVEGVGLVGEKMLNKHMSRSWAEPFTEHRDYFCPVRVEPAMLLDHGQPVRVRQGG